MYASSVQQQTGQLRARASRGSGVSGPSEEEYLWRDMAEKDYHIANQLGE